MKLIKCIKIFLKKLSSDHVGEYAAQCAYFTFLSFIPFIILLLSLIKYINIEKETLAYILEVILPTIMKNNVLDIIQEAYSKSIKIVSISAILVLWSAGKSFYALTLGLLAIYKTSKRKNYIFLRIKGIIGTIVTLLLIITVLILLVFGNMINEIIKEKFLGLSSFIAFALKFRTIIVITSLFFIFILMYKFIPNEKGSKFKSQIPGALFASISWLLISFFFSIYVDIFTNFSVVYGSLGTIILIMMWLYSVIYAILIGAEINIFTSDLNYFRKKKI